MTRTKVGESAKIQAWGNAKFALSMGSLCFDYLDLFFGVFVLQLFAEYNRGHSDAYAKAAKIVIDFDRLSDSH